MVRDWVFRVSVMTAVGIVIAVLGVVAAIAITGGTPSRFDAALEAVLLAGRVGALFGFLIGLIAATVFVTIRKWQPWTSIAAVGAVASIGAGASAPFDPSMSVAIVLFTAAVLGIGEFLAQRQRRNQTAAV